MGCVGILDKDVQLPTKEGKVNFLCTPDRPSALVEGELEKVPKQLVD
jgi:hypothetical protein